MNARLARSMRRTRDSWIQNTTATSMLNIKLRSSADHLLGTRSIVLSLLSPRLLHRSPVHQRLNLNQVSPNPALSLLLLPLSRWLSLNIVDLKLVLNNAPLLLLKK